MLVQGLMNTPRTSRTLVLQIHYQHQNTQLGDGNTVDRYLSEWLAHSMPSFRRWRSLAKHVSEDFTWKNSRKEGMC